MITKTTSGIADTKVSPNVKQGREPIHKYKAYLPLSAMRKLRLAAADRCVSMSDVLTELVNTLPASITAPQD